MQQDLPRPSTIPQTKSGDSYVGIPRKAVDRMILGVALDRIHGAGENRDETLSPSLPNSGLNSEPNSD